MDIYDIIINYGGDLLIAIVLIVTKIFGKKKTADALEKTLQKKIDKEKSKVSKQLNAAEASTERIQKLQDEYYNKVVQQNGDVTSK